MGGTFSKALVFRWFYRDQSWVMLLVKGVSPIFFMCSYNQKKFDITVIFTKRKVISIIDESIFTQIIRYR